MQCDYRNELIHNQEEIKKEFVQKFNDLLLPNAKIDMFEYAKLKNKKAKKEKQMIY